MHIFILRFLKVDRSVGWRENNFFFSGILTKNIM